jgi:hypothetical protein
MLRLLIFRILSAPRVLSVGGSIGNVPRRDYETSPTGITRLPLPPPDSRARLIDGVRGCNILWAPLGCRQIAASPTRMSTRATSRLRNDVPPSEIVLVGRDMTQVFT